MVKPKRIMVIDDSEVVLARVKRALIVAGHEVIATSQVVGNARHLPTCDLVILDYHMPGLNGSSVMSSLRSLAGSLKNECPIYLYTSDPQIERNYAQLGFDGAFMDKGDEPSLVRQVAAVFRRVEIRLAVRQKQVP